MAVSKKTRFEIFKRDGFRCQYCGKYPPDVMLEVDHIQPKSKKGSDDINNLVTSCFDCNRGKSNRELSAIPNSLVLNSEILAEKEAQYKEYKKLISKINNRIKAEFKEVVEVFETYYYPKTLTEKFKKTSLKLFIEKLNIIEVVNSMESACMKFESVDREKVYVNNVGWIKKEDAVIKYFCGICWNKIRNK
jgi:hypothetical protein